MKIFDDRDKKHRIVKRLKPIWKEMECTLTDHPEEADIHFSVIKRLWKTTLPWVVRLDNVYYDKELSYRNRPLNSSHIKADGIIYQSNYSKQICEAFLKPRKGKYRVIYNGHEPNWTTRIKPTESFNILVISRWRRHKRLYEILSVFKELSKWIKTDLHVIGGMVDENDKRFAETQKILENTKNAYYYGRVVDKDELKRIFGLADCMLHISKRDSCPNTVVEAITARIPVVTTNACGGATEMVAMVDKNNIVDGEDDKMPEAVNPYTEEWNELDNEILHKIVFAVIRQAEKTPKIPVELTARYCAQEYINFFKTIIENV